MHRFYVDAALAQSDIHLPPHIARQVTTVLRMRAGDRVVLFDGSGQEWVGELIELGKTATVRVIERRDSLGAPRRAVTLCQALLKGEKMEWVLQKATELGVAAFQPVLTERVVAQKSEISERWRRIVIEAAEQSGRAVLPALHPPVPLEAALQAGGASAFCWESERTATLWSYVAAGAPDSLRLYIGPEGGFSDREVSLARELGADVLSLGPLVLRAETAAVAASALALLAP